MHPLALGAFCLDLSEANAAAFNGLNAPFGARCFLSKPGATS